MTTTSLRPMRWQDLPEVHRIEEDSFVQDPWSLASFWGELASRPRRDYVVLQAAGDDAPTAAVLGYAGLDLAGDTADVMTIAVDRARRGEGHGVVLLQQLLRRAGESGATQVLLEVRADNVSAIGLYERHGFEVLRLRPGYYHGVDALIMRKEVGGRG